MGYSRQAVVNLVTSWEGKKEADGSYKSIIDLYNKLPVEQLPRRTRMMYGWAWCACTWSALAVQLGYLAIMPIEISCHYLIENAKKMGVWIENDAHIPQPGDAILYDWKDSGNGDNVGMPDHVGTVIYVNKSAGYMVVMEGNYSDAVKRRTVSLNGKYIRGFITPNYDSGTVTTPVQEAGKTLSIIVHEVIAGQWGNGPDRKIQLEAKGYNYDIVQEEVDRILNGSATKPKTDTQDQSQPIAKRVTSTCYARQKDASLSGTYETTTNLYCRNDAGKNKKALCLIPSGTKVQNYGFYNTANGVKWLYIQFVMDGVQYTGFSSIEYLKRK